MHKVNNAFKSLLCLTISVLISLIELQFFQGSDIYSLEFLIILVLTVPTIYLYFLPKHETMIIFLYTIVLVYILDFIGRDVNIKLLLITLFCIILLFAQSLYTSNAKNAKVKKPAFLPYTLMLIVILSIVSLLSFYIYEYVLMPNINETNQLSIIKIKTPDSNSQLKEEVQDSFGGSGGADSGNNDVFDFKLMLLILSILLLLSILLFVLTKFIKYKLWINRTLKSCKKEQIRQFYMYFLSSFSILGFKRNKSETPFEYLERIEKEDFYFSKDEFRLLTNVFVSSNYGNEIIYEKDYSQILNFFYSISKTLRNKLGLNKYLFRYVLKLKS